MSENRTSAVDVHGKPWDPAMRQDVLSLPDAERLAEGIYAVLRDKPYGVLQHERVREDVRERVASDLAGLAECYRWGTGSIPSTHAGHAQRASDGLLRTAALYGVEP